MKKQETPPTVVLICHEQDPLDTEGLASWLANTMNLVGSVIIRDRPGRLWSVARRQIRRRGLSGFADAVVLRLYARLWLSGHEEAWKTEALARVRARYPADLTKVPRLVVTNPNSPEVHDFLTRLQPDLTIARCKVMLTPRTFRVARVGSFALHPGICPEYRNAHGCFWALAQRDLERVGMTLLKVDEGVDTGAIYLQATYPFDEVRESHTVIQYRVVLENLDAIAHTLISLCRGENVEPMPTIGRRSKAWGHPGITDYLKWKRMARRRAGSTPHTLPPRPASARDGDPSLARWGTKSA